MNPPAIVFDVQRFSVHDGPGIRTVVFFKGCTLRCRWCQNPESIEPSPELAYYEDRCLRGCEACVPSCPEKALRPSREDRVDFDRCTACGKCIGECPADALRIVGRSVTPGELLAEVARDRPFFAASDGGITVSGGEPVLQAEFLSAFLPLCKEAGLHRALETAGNYAFRRLEPLLPLVDLVLYDLKLADGPAHLRATGSDGGRVRANLSELVSRKVPLQVRMPVVPGINDGAGDVCAAAEALTALGIRELKLLRYNALWEAKLPRLRTSQERLGIAAPGDDHCRALVARFERSGISARF